MKLNKKIGWSQVNSFNTRELKEYVCEDTKDAKYKDTANFLQLIVKIPACNLEALSYVSFKVMYLMYLSYVSFIYDAGIQKEYRLNVHSTAQIIWSWKDLMSSYEISDF